MKPGDEAGNPRDELDETTLLSEGPAEDPRLLGAVREYMNALDAGLRPSRREWLERYPEIAKELAACLDGLAFVHSAAGKMHAAEGAPDFPEGTMARPLGDFRLIKEIGRGGMGVVYEAIQLSLGRKVAVKVLPFTAALDPRHLERFRNEASAAAHLHHTNIVPVYAVGCERSVHYYAMQLIEGESLAEVIRELRNIASMTPPGNEGTGGSASTTALSLRRHAEVAPGTGTSSAMHSSAKQPEVTAASLNSLRSDKPAAFYQSVARLGQQAADALQYAHEAGVVHRDIKPANLMVDDRGKPWITDFGLAQFYSDAELTQTGDLVGTIAYMSPEQASGKAVVLDQRTDVYSLGITLYELLTLQRAFPAKNREELLQQVSTMEPRSVRQIDKRIPRELETILEKAAAKDPAERYQSAHEFSEDLRRFLTDEPIHARPPSTWDKAVKWTRRHKSLAVSALLVLFIASAGFLTSTILIAREQQRTQANFEQARNAVDFFARVAEEQMTGPPTAEARRTLLEHALAYYSEFMREHVDDATTRTEIEAAQQAVTDILQELTASEARDRVSRRIEMLQEPAVQLDLVMSEQQISNAADLYDRIWQPGSMRIEPSGTQSSKARQEQYTLVADEGKAGLQKILNTKQYERLKQIVWQASGPMAFKDAEVLQKLDVTTAQQVLLNQLFEQDMAAHGPGGPHGPRNGRFGGPMGGIDGGSDDGPPRGPRGIGEGGSALMNKMLAVLTPQQQEAWKTLIGAPYKGPSMRGRFGGRRGGGGGGFGPH
ncbi:MAG: serine/threonine-protein kinase [Phycisphaerae bacterium]